MYVHRHLDQPVRRVVGGQVDVGRIVPTDQQGRVDGDVQVHEGAGRHRAARGRDTQPIHQRPEHDGHGVVDVVGVVGDGQSIVPGLVLDADGGAVQRPLHRQVLVNDPAVGVEDHLEGQRAGAEVLLHVGVLNDEPCAVEVGVRRGARRAESQVVVEGREQVLRRTRSRQCAVGKVRRCAGEAQPAVRAHVHGGEGVAVEREAHAHVDRTGVVVVDRRRSQIDRRSDRRDVEPVEGRSARFVGIDPLVAVHVRSAGSEDAGPGKFFALAHLDIRIDRYVRRTDFLQRDGVSQVTEALVLQVQRPVDHVTGQQVLGERCRCPHRDGREDSVAGHGHADRRVDRVVAVHDDLGIESYRVHGLPGQREQARRTRSQREAGVDLCDLLAAVTRLQFADDQRRVGGDDLGDVQDVGAGVDHPEVGQVRVARVAGSVVVGVRDDARNRDADDVQRCRSLVLTDVGVQYHGADEVTAVAVRGVEDDVKVERLAGGHRRARGRHGQPVRRRADLDGQVVVDVVLVVSHL